MSPRMLSYGVAGLMAASAFAAPAVVTKTYTDLVIETHVVQANGNDVVAPIVNAPAPAAPAPKVQIAAPAPAPAAAPAAAPAVNVAASVPTTGATASKVDTDTSVATGGKRGLLLDNTGAMTPFLASLSNGKFSWFANWVSASKGVSAPGLEFVPQLKTMFADVWNSEAGASIASGSKYLLGLNEPDIASQENMSVDAAISQWHELMEPFADQAKLVSPSVSNSESAGMGLDWLSDFLTKCEASGCHIHACGYHWHDTSADINYFKERIQAAHAVCGDKPLWISEFSADTDEASQAAFVQQATAYLDSLDYVERYAYFQASTMDSGSALNSIGAAYAASA